MDNSPNLFDKMQENLNRRKESTQKVTTTEEANSSFELLANAKLVRKQFEVLRRNIYSIQLDDSKNDWEPKKLVLSRVWNSPKSSKIFLY